MSSKLRPLVAILILFTFSILPLNSSSAWAAGETIVAGNADQYPSTQIKGAYWYDAVKTEQGRSWNKTRVVEDRTLPARSFFVPAASRNEALKPLKEWRSQKNWQSLNSTKTETWKFKLVKKPAEVITNFHEPQFVAAGWKEFPVPGIWQLQPNEINDQPIYSNWYYAWGQKSWTLFGKPNVPGETVNYSMAMLMTAPANYNPVGHYLRDFTVPAEQAGKQAILNFQGVQSAFYVYVNGKYVGYSEDSFTQHEFDITKFLNPSGKNRLAVLVYRWSDGSLLENQDMVNYSGIIRDVGLIYRDKNVHLNDFSNIVTVNANRNSARLTTKVILPSTAKAKVYLYEHDSDTEVGHSDIVSDGQTATITVANPKIWSAEAPNLYRQVIEVLDTEGKSIEYVGYELGIREIALKEISNGKTTYTINGEPIVFKGVNRHELYNTSGHVENLALLHKDLQIMKQHNVNAIRTSHYPNSVDLYILANEYGLMICDEANLETHAAGGTNGIPMAVEAFRYPALHRGINMYQRDKNFSAVVVWSNGNECIFFIPPAVNDKYSFALMYKYIHENDPQRPVVLERDPREGVTDIRSRMYWAASEHDNFSFMEPIEANDKKILEAKDKRPYFQVEYAHSMGNSLGYYKEYWDLWRQYPHAMGGFIWDWVDQSPMWPIPAEKVKAGVQGMSYTADGKKVPSGGTHYYAYGGDWAMDKNNNFNNFMDNGLISSDRIPHDSHQQLAYVQQNVLFEQFNPEAWQVKVKNEFAFTNLNNYQFQAQILKDGKIVGSKNFRVDIAPVSAKTISLPDISDILPTNVKSETKAQYHLQINVLLSSDTGLWGKAGDRIAFEQWPINQVDKVSYKVPIETGYHNIVKDEANQVVVSNERFSFTLDKTLGQWTKYSVAGEEYFAQPNEGSTYKTSDGRDMTPGMYANFWRAPVDNDREGDYLKRMKYWREANWWKKSTKVTIAQNRADVTNINVFSVYKNGSWVTEDYTIFSDGHIRYHQTLDPYTGAKLLPSVGAIFEIKPDFNNLSYYGRGPATSFVDRKVGYPEGIYQEKVDENVLGNYVKPQENGNHVDVFWAQLSNAKGKGIFVKSSRNDEPLEVMASPYNQYDIADHTHPYEITWANKIFFRVAFKNQGVGGENSWGARPLPYAEVEAKKQSHEFDIFPITNTSITMSGANNAHLNTNPHKPQVAYPETDVTKLYRTWREDPDFIKQVDIKRHALGQLERLTDFQDSTYYYEIAYQNGQDPATADVEITMVHPEIFKVVKENKGNGLVVVKIFKQNNETTNIPIATYQFKFLGATNVKPDSPSEPPPVEPPAPDPKPNDGFLPDNPLPEDGNNPHPVPSVVPSPSTPPKPVVPIANHSNFSSPSKAHNQLDNTGVSVKVPLEIGLGITVIGLLFIIIKGHRFTKKDNKSGQV